MAQRDEFGRFRLADPNQDRWDHQRHPAHPSAAPLTAGVRSCLDRGKFPFQFGNRSVDHAAREVIDR